MQPLEPLSKSSRIPGWTWFALLGFFALAFAVIPFEERFAAYVVERKGHIWEWFKFVLLGTGFLFFIQLVRTLPNGNRLLIGFFTPVIISTAITHLLKVIFARARPFTGQGNLYFEWMTARGELASFPSGHSTYAFCVATLFFLHVPKTRWVMLVWAPAVAFERILTEKHYLSDVIAGAAIGAFSAAIASTLLGKRFYSFHELSEENTSAAP